MIAIAIAGDPELIIADEPTTALDVTVQAQVLRCCSRLRDEIGCSIVLITHDLGVAAQISDRIAVLYAGRIAEIGPTAEVLGASRSPVHPRAAALSADAGHRSATASSPRSPVQCPVPDVPLPGCAFAPRCALATDDCTATPPDPDRCRARPVSACILPSRRRRGASSESRRRTPQRPLADPERDEQRPAALGGVQDVTKTFTVSRHGKLQALRGISLQRRPRRIGGAGRGKRIGQVHAVADHRRAGESHVRVGRAGRRPAAADGVPGRRRFADPVAVGR